MIALSFTQDRGGAVVRMDEAMASIAAAAPVPVISPNISSLGQGILAGNINGGSTHGEFTARVATRVLHGEPPANIRIEPEGGFGPVFDYRQMERWDIREDQLPREAVVLNRPTGIWATYRKWVLLAGGLIGLQMAIIGLLAWSIAARRTAERALRQSELRHREMVEKAIDGIYSHDLDGRMTEINQTLVDILGYERHELLAMSSVTLVAPEHRAKVLESTAKKAAGIQSPPYEIVVITKDGRRLWVEVSSRLLLNNGHPSGVEGVIRDISQRKNLESQLQQAQKMEAIGRLAGGVAHDFNNLLTVICGYANLLIGEASNPKQRDRLDQIRRAGDQATQLTRHLLSFSRSQAMEPALVDLNHVVSDMVKMLRRFIGEDVTIVTRLEPEIGTVLADPTQLGQVVMNLALNARDAMPGGGTLTIETSNNRSSSWPSSPRRSEGQRYRGWNGRGSPAPGFRSVLHHQGAWARDRTRTVRCLRNRAPL